MPEYTLAVSAGEVARYRSMAAAAAEQEALLWQRAGIVPGAVVADVGCGPAATSVELARAVAPGGRVVGVEREQEALAAAREVLADAGVDVELRQGDAADTGLEPASVDVAVLRHVLAHNGGAEAAIVGHLAGLVRPGGCVYLVDVDLTGIRFLDAGPDVEDLTARYCEFHRRRGNDPVVGIRLGQLLRGAGLEVLTHEGRYAVMDPPPGVRPPSWAARDAMVADGVASEQDVSRWDEALTALEAAARPVTVFAPVFVAVGRRTA